MVSGYTKTIGLTIALLALFLIGCNTQAQQEISLSVSNTASIGDTASTPTSDVKIFTLTGANFKFMMENNEGPEMRVKLGDTVRVEFTSTEGFHDWVLDEFNAATQKVRAGNSTSVEFIADKKGTFEYYCSVGSHRAMGMKGNFIVE